MTENITNIPIAVIGYHYGFSSARLDKIGLSDWDS